MEASLIQKLAPKQTTIMDVTAIIVTPTMRGDKMGFGVAIYTDYTYLVDKDGTQANTYEIVGSITFGEVFALVRMCNPPNSNEMMYEFSSNTTISITKSGEILNIYGD